MELGTIKPNVIICQCDEMRAFELSCYGNKAFSTPNIDKLATQGTRFDCAVTNNPVCVPARSCLLTGQYSRTCGGSLDNSFADKPSPKRERLIDTTIAEQFKSAGYKTALIGKWHTYTLPSNVGFDYSLYPAVPHKYCGQTYYEDNREFIVNEFTEEYNIKHVEKYIKENRDNPFFLYYNISLPHMPLLADVPEKYTKMFTRDDVILRENVIRDGKLPYDKHRFLVYLYDHIYYNHPDKENLFKLSDDFDIYDLTALYYGAIMCVDDMVGRLLGALKENDLAENTIILFNSDHGDNLGSHECWNKNMMIEESIRIPMIFSYPEKIKIQENKEQIAQTIDIMPSLLEFAGLEVPDTVQGRSLLPILKGEKNQLTDNYAFIETDSYKIGIRTPEYMYGIEISKDEKEVINDALYFYNVKNDPFELNNNAGTEYDTQTADNFRNILFKWNEKTPWLVE